MQAVQLVVEGSCEKRVCEHHRNIDQLKYILCTRVLCVLHRFDPENCL